MRVSCRLHRPVDVLPSFLLCPEDAIQVLLAIHTDNPESRYIALVTDPDRRGRLAIPFPPEVADELGAIEEVCDLLLTAAGDDDPWNVPCLVLCTCRDDVGLEPTDEERASWERIQEQCRNRGGVELLDWFLLSDVVALSMAEVAGPGWDDSTGFSEKPL